MGQTFEHRDVVGTGIKMAKVDGPLGKALSVNDLHMELGDEGALVIWYTTKEIQHKIDPDRDGVQRVHVLAMLNAAPVDRTAVAELLATQEARQARPTLPLGDDGEGGPDQVGD